MYIPGSQATAREVRPTWYKSMPEKIWEKLTEANLIGLGCALVAIACLLGLPAGQYWNIRIPLYLLVSVWTCLRPRVALYLLPLAIPWGSLDQIGSLSSADILVALLAGSWLLSYTLRPLFPRWARQAGALDYEDRALPRPLLVAMLVLLLTMLVSMTVASSYLTSVKEIVKWVEVLIIFVAGAPYLRTRRQIWGIFVIACIAAIGQALLGYAQVFFNLGPSSFVRDASLRVYGTFNQPNPYAGYMNMILAPALALTLLGRNLAIRVLAGGTAVLLAGAEFYSQSKGGFLAIAVAVIAILVIGFPRLRPLILAVFIAALLLLCAFLLDIIPVSLIEPTLVKWGFIDISFTAPTSDNFANAERLAHWLAGLQMFQDHPLLGVGIGNYEYAYSQYHLGIFVNPLGHAHNYYINSAAETGLIGLVAFVMFLSTCFASGVRAYRQLNTRYRQAKRQAVSARARVTTVERYHTIRQLSILGNDRALAIGLVAALISACVHNLVDNLYVHGLASLFALLLILLIRLGSVSTFRNART